MKPIQVGLLGIGTVGSGTFNVLQRNQEEIQRRAGRGIEITMVADLDVERAKSPWWARACQVVNDARAVIANPDIDIVIELIGGYGIAKALVLEAIAAASMWSPPTRRCWPCMAPRFSRRIRQGRDGGV
jgi:homoserine dehydrogenase